MSLKIRHSHLFAINSVGLSGNTPRKSFPYLKRACRTSLGLAGRRSDDRLQLKTHQAWR